MLHSVLILILFIHPLKTKIMLERINSDTMLGIHTLYSKDYLLSSLTSQSTSLMKIKLKNF